MDGKHLPTPLRSFRMLQVSHHCPNLSGHQLSEELHYSFKDPNHSMMATLSVIPRFAIPVGNQASRTFKDVKHNVSIHKFPQSWILQYYTTKSCLICGKSLSGRSAHKIPICSDRILTCRIKSIRSPAKVGLVVTDLITSPVVSWEGWETPPPPPAPRLCCHSLLNHRRGKTSLLLW